MKPSLFCAALQMAGQWCKMAEKSLTQLIFICTVAFGVFAVVVYFLLEPLLDRRTANLAVMTCAITPGAILAPAVFVLAKQFVAGMSEKIHDARVAREREEREYIAKMRSLDAAASSKEFQAQITAGRASAFDLQKADDGSWEIPVNWG